MHLHRCASDPGINLRCRGILSNGWFRAQGTVLDYTVVVDLCAVLRSLSQGRIGNWERTRNLSMGIWILDLSFANRCQVPSDAFTFFRNSQLLSNAGLLGGDSEVVEGRRCSTSHRSRKWSIHTRIPASFAPLEIGRLSGRNTRHC
jgi:hypothetical protein